MTSSLRPPLDVRPLLWFGLLAAAIITTEYVLVHQVGFSRHPALPSAAAFDLLVTLPGVFYWVVVRRYQLPLSTVAGAVGAGLALSHWLLPATTVPLLVWAGRLGAVGEVATLGYAAVRIRRIRRGYLAARQHSADFMENLLEASQPVLGRLAEAVATEVAVLRYAVLGAWAPPEVGPGEVAFSAHRKSGFGALLATFAGLSVLELAVAHLVVGHWWPRAAWGLTVASAYGVLWLLAHGQAVRRRPVLLAGATLVVRVGLVWRVAIPRAQLLHATPLADAPAAAPGVLNAARLLLTPPNLLLTLAAPQRVRGPYGLHRTVQYLAIYVDEPAALRQQLAAAAPTA